MSQEELPEERAPSGKPRHPLLSLLELGLLALGLFLLIPPVPSEPDHVYDFASAGWKAGLFLVLSRVPAGLRGEPPWLLFLQALVLGLFAFGWTLRLQEGF